MYRESSPSAIFLGIALSVSLYLYIYIYITLYQYTNIFPPICHSFPRICHYNSSHCTSALDPIIYPIVYPINIPHDHSSRYRLPAKNLMCSILSRQINIKILRLIFHEGKTPFFAFQAQKSRLQLQRVQCGPPSYRLVYKPH